MQVSPKIGSPLSRAAWISLTASSHVTCTTNSGRPVHSARRMARDVASPSTSGGRVEAWNFGSVSPRSSASFW